MSPDAQRPSGPLPGVAGRAAAALYERIMAFRNRRFDAGRGVATLDRPVISIGNLSTGGTGKSPMVRHIVGVLSRAGFSPCVAMRGYKSRAGLSDEAEELRGAFPGLPVVVRADRARGLADLFATPAGARVDCVVLDDGFQHRRLARDLDVVLIDATRSPFADRLLPAGWLREPVESLARAGAIVLTHTERMPATALRSLRGSAAACAPHAILAECKHEWAGLLAADGTRLVERLLHGRRVYAACAIGNPAAFIARALDACGGSLVGRLVLRDHDPFSERTVRRLIAGARAADAEFILVTGKDWSKLARIDPSRWPCRVVRPDLRMVFTAGEDELKGALGAAIERGAARAGPGARPGER